MKAIHINTLSISLLFVTFIMQGCSSNVMPDAPLSENPYKDYLEISGHIDDGMKYKVTVNYSTNTKTNKCSSYIWAAGSYYSYSTSYEFEPNIQGERHSLKIPLHSIEDDECNWKPFYIAVDVITDKSTGNLGIYGAPSRCRFTIDMLPERIKKLDMLDGENDIDCVPVDPNYLLGELPVFKYERSNKVVIFNFYKHDTYYWKSRKEITKEVSSKICHIEPFDNTFINTVIKSGINLGTDFGKIDCGNSPDNIRVDNLLKSAALYRTDVLKMLTTSYGLDINTLDKKGLTLLDWIDSLIKSGAKITYHSPDYLYTVRQSILKLGGKKSKDLKN